MNRVWLRAVGMATVLAPFTTSVLAQPVPYQVDKDHFLIGFQVRHFFNKVPGAHHHPRHLRRATPPSFRDLE